MHRFLLLSPNAASSAVVEKRPAITEHIQSACKYGSRSTWAMVGSATDSPYIHLLLLALITSKKGRSSRNIMRGIKRAKVEKWRGIKKSWKIDNEPLESPKLAVTGTSTHWKSIYRPTIVMDTIQKSWRLGDRGVEKVGKVEKPALRRMHVQPDM